MRDSERMHYALLGDPVHHSLSPALHNAWFRDLGIDASYLCLSFQGTGEALAQTLLALGLSGCNLTTPLKQTILPHLASCGPDATRSGAVNTVCIEGGELHGYNTDVVGFKESLGEHQVRLRGQRAVVAGAGGAARAVGVACADLGISEVVFVNRTLQKAEALAQDLSEVLPQTRWLANHTAAGTALQQPVLLFVDATRSPTPPENLQKLIQNTTTPSICFDLNYWRDPSVWNHVLPHEGLTFFDGRDMLLQQAVHAFRLFTRETPNLSIGRAALSGAIQPAHTSEETHG